ncbi:serine/threonine-protein kinase [Euzebya tangerina]|uniref:serine/threonine-protein kinase n=1 Tax=Euzebya tangerina TaxID=591198 RepID=UPI000E317D36|nr:serine/threonine-protein kinase [Euzebya tangerina]
MATPHRIPGFDDLTPIGRGGFGVVYRSPQQGFGRDVAIKVLSVDATQLDSVARRRFETETTTTGQLSTHPHIVTLHQTGLTEGGHPYLVMAYMTGGSLGQRLATEGPLSWDEATAIAIKIAGALGTAHRAGIIHRDVKPDNIMVDEFGAPVLGDFGIASVTSGDVSTMTATGKITGTVAYSPPELLDGGRPDELTDVFALAATTFALVVGHAPFVRPDDQSFTQVVARMMRDDAPSLEQFGVPGPVATAVARGLARSPEQRTPSVVRLGQDLQAARRTVGAGDVPMVLPKGSDQGTEQERTLALPPVAIPPVVTSPDQAPLTVTPTTPTTPVVANPPPVTPMTPDPRGQTTPSGSPDPYPSYAYESGTPAPVKRSRVPGWGTVVVSLLLLAALAGGGVYLALDRQDNSELEQAIAPAGGPAPTGTPSSAAQTSAPDSGPTATSTPPSTPTPPDEPTSPAPTTPPATPNPPPPDPPPPAGLPVDITADHPDAPALASVLGRWGAGINEGAYADAFDLYSPALRDRVTFTRFADGNSTSTISDARLLQVTEDGPRRRVIIRFQSNQSAELGPDGQTCSRWELRWTLIPAAGQDWLVDDVDASQGFPQSC